MEEMLPIKMSEQFAEKGLDCDIVVKYETDEADYFFDFINSD